MKNNKSSFSSKDILVDALISEEAIANHYYNLLYFCEDDNILEKYNSIFSGILQAQNDIRKEMYSRKILHSMIAKKEDITTAYNFLKDMNSSSSSLF